MSMEPDCIFCQIVAGTAPSAMVMEDDLTFAFMDIYPVAPGHTLVIPKQHAANIYEMEPESIAAVARTAWRIARAIERELSPDGLQVFQLNGAAAGQTVFHYHTHLLPRQSGDPISLHSRTRAGDADLHAMAERLRGALE